MIYAESCYSCHFNGFPRVVDITLGDFLGLGVVAKIKFYGEKGISAVLLNSKKGVELYELCKGNIIHERRSLEEVCYMNKSLWCSTKKNDNREYFYLELRDHGLVAVFKKYVWDIKTRLILMIKRCIIFSLGERRTLVLMYKKGLMQKGYLKERNTNAYMSCKERE